MAELLPVMLVQHVRLGRVVTDPSLATVRLSTDQAAGPHFDFMADAVTLDLIIAALTKAAKDLRKRAN